MSVPTAVFGLNPKMRISIGVISDPPPMPVMPTSVPTARPAITNCQVMGGSFGRLHDHAGADGLVRRLVDEHERAGGAVLRVRVHGERLGKPDAHDAEVV